MNYQQENIRSLAAQLHSYGYAVYVAKSGPHGFYTDGKRVVSFGSTLGVISFSGNYKTDQPRSTGTGWMIVEGPSNFGQMAAEVMIKSHAPGWATKDATKVEYTTPEQHLQVYRKICGFELYEA